MHSDTYITGFFNLVTVQPVELQTASRNYERNIIRPGEKAYHSTMRETAEEGHLTTISTG